MNQGPLTIYTWGYSGEAPATLARIRTDLNALIVDTRFSPQSQRADWRKGGLEKLFGPDYRWMQEFGNLNYKGGWTDPVVLKDPKAGLVILEPLVGPDRPPLLICFCPTPCCHRSDVAAYLSTEKGWPIVHLPTQFWRPGDPIGPPPKEGYKKKYPPTAQGLVTPGLF